MIKNLHTACEMKKQNLFIPALVLLLLTFSNSFSQNDRPKSSFHISAGAGIFSFMGDIGNGDNVNSFSYTRGGYSLSLEGRFARQLLGFSLTGTTGKLAMSERSILPDRNTNFESSLTELGLNFTLYLQNKSPVTPYINVGIASVSFNTKTDIKHDGDSLYYYWADGSIRNLPEAGTNALFAKKITRDYKYESPLDDAEKKSLAIPIGLGFKFKAGTKIDVNIGTSYHICMTDKIDAMEKGKNDAYIFSYASVGYNIFKKETKKSTKPSSAVDYSSIDRLDSDNDGVKDIDDACAATPKGVKVDLKGCPLDQDEDGVPDYQDKEQNTAKGTIVNAEGRAITKDMLAKEKAKKDSLLKSFQANPSYKKAQDIDKEIKSNSSISSNKVSKIPLEFRSADTNADDIISSSEVSAVIEGFFDGSNNYTVEKIHALIDYFFEQ